MNKIMIIPVIILSVLGGRTAVCGNVPTAPAGALPAPKTTSTAVQYSVIGTLLIGGVGTLLILDGAKGMGADEGEVALGIGIGALGVILGPSFGHAYADRPKPMKGSWVRLAGATVTGLGLAGMGIADSFGGSEGAGVYVVMGMGGAIYLYGAISDVATLGRSVEQYNHRHGLSRVKIRPCYFAQQDAVGLKLTIGID